MRHSIPPIELIAIAAERLGALVDRVTFLGGAVVGLLITDQASRPPRATQDVDVAIEIGTRVDYYELEKLLLARGFRNAIEGPICRFDCPPLVLDVMPTNPDILGFSNRWYRAAVHTAEQTRLANGRTINLITPVCFLATKLEAFSSSTRADHGDLMASRDFEDIVVLLDGRPSIVDEAGRADADVQTYVQARLTELLESGLLADGISAHLESDSASQSRLSSILDRFEALAHGG